MRQILSTVLFVALCFPFLAQVYGEEIVHWDFSDGIPEGWVNESASGVAVWEYRGPVSIPNITVCSRGSCGEGSQPIGSISQENGFVIFDSNYWDDEEGPCGNLGSGIDPAPHLACLITSPIDLSDQEAAVLTFQQSYKFFTTESTIEISIDGGLEYSTLIANPSTQGATSPVVEWVSVNISEIAAGQSDVRFKFNFDGLYYWWCLDDIVVYSPLDNDLLIEQPKYTLYNGQLFPSSFGDLEYNAYPQIMIPPFHFSALAQNIGGFDQYGVALNVKVRRNGNTIVYDQSTNPTTLNAGVSTTFSINAQYLPLTQVADYEILYELVQDQEDESPLNNFTELDYQITDYVYARDEGAMEDRYTPWGILDSLEYAVGNVFESTAAGLEFHSISVAFADSSRVGAPVYGIIYDLMRDSVYGQTDIYNINEFDLNSPGEEKIVTLPLQVPVITLDTTIYLVMIAQQDSLQRMSIARSGPSPAQSSLVYFPTTNGLYYMLQSPIVRINLFSAGSISGCLDELAMNYNPEAIEDDGSCQYAGCTNDIALNYDPDANYEDGSCMIEGCTDPEAVNFNPDATEEDGSCQYPGCTDALANNFDADANFDDGSCTYDQAVFSVDILEGCAPLGIIVTNQTETQIESECFFDMGDGNVYLDCDEQFGWFFDDPGEYTIVYVYTIGEATSEFQIGPIIVHALPDAPVPSYDEENNILSCAGCDDATEITWYINGDAIDENNASWQPINNGLYSVEIMDVNGCTATSDEIVVIVTGIPGIQYHEALIVFPNPATHYVIFDSQLEEYTLSIFNSSGELLLLEHVSGTKLHKVQVEDFASGIVFYRVQAGSDSFTGKISIR